MRRKAPAAPQWRENELDRALDLAVAPRLPEGLAARIKADVTRLPQDAPIAASALQRAPVATRAQLPSHAAARSPRRWVGAGAGLAALAAGLAVFALVGAPRQDDPSAPGADTQDSASALVAAPTPGVVAAPATQVPARLAIAGHVAPRATAKADDARADDAGAPLPAPETSLSPEPDALAVAMPPAAPDGPAAAPDANEAAPVPGVRGQMGPALPQGFGYTGGAPGSIPSGAPVTMSGGPGMGGAGRGGPGPRH
ncbi:MULTISPECIES: hypothetical protein [Novosphingobium]|uniref:hypothetical protein n=1 Tax=Novosphingobium TaxID=165696 RepID=UPI001CD2D917|nr:hypothetical protein [Novosphingobium percolationis]